jgi:hypothetical protein
MLEIHDIEGDYQKRGDWLSGNAARTAEVAGIDEFELILSHRYGTSARIVRKSYASGGGRFGQGVNGTGTKMVGGSD